MLGLGLAASESFIADCRQGILGYRLPVAGYRYITYLVFINCRASVRILSPLNGESAARTEPTDR